MTWLLASPSGSWGQGSRMGHGRREVNENRETATQEGESSKLKSQTQAFDERPLAVNLAECALCSCSSSRLLG